MIKQILYKLIPDLCLIYKMLAHCFIYSFTWVSISSLIVLCTIFNHLRPYLVYHPFSGGFQQLNQCWLLCIGKWLYIAKQRALNLREINIAFCRNDSMVSLAVWHLALCFWKNRSFRLCLTIFKKKTILENVSVELSIEGVIGYS